MDSRRIRSKHTLAAAFGLLLLAVAGCEPETADLWLEGYVTDERSGAPLPGLPVALTWTTGAYSIDGIGTASGVDGRYVLIAFEVACDGLTLSAGNASYELEQYDVRCTDDVQRIDFELGPG